MSAASIVMVSVALVALAFTLRPRLMRAPLWRATVTPLASIIGSGFLVVGPILGHAAGNWAWLAMLGLCLTAYLFGAAVRRNILLVEPMMENGPPRTVAVLERCADLALAFAYFVSVAYYLNLFASFLLRAADIVDPAMTRLISSATIIGLGIFGAFRGLKALENVEEGAVGLKLGLIAGLLAALAFAALAALVGGTLRLPDVAHTRGFRELSILLGLIILVQGFETSRYLGDAYDGAMRIKTMRYAQWLSSAIYLGFVVLITPYFTGTLPERGGETAIIDMLAPLGAIVAPLIILVALASQLSAAVADMNGAGGLLADSTHRQIPARVGYLITAAVAVWITWAANIYEIIVYASKAFVVYYALQCSIATLVATRKGAGRSVPHQLVFGLGTVISLLVLIFGIPADSG